MIFSKQNKAINLSSLLNIANCKEKLRFTYRNVTNFS